MDCFYSSIALADELWYELKSVRFNTMQLNRKHTPEVLKINKNRKFQSSKFLFLNSNSTEHVLFIQPLNKRDTHFHTYSILNSGQFHGRQ